MENNNQQATNMTSEQQEIFDKYFRRIKDTHVVINTSTNLHIGLRKFQVSRETETVLEIKVKDTVIAMWKQVNHIHITIL
jgi:hypothetical protein